LNWRERILDFVRNPSRHLTPRLHPFHPDDLRDVFKETDRPKNIVLLVRQ